jgi:hypothetical protein
MIYVEIFSFPTELTRILIALKNPVPLLFGDGRVVVFVLLPRRRRQDGRHLSVVRFLVLVKLRYPDALIAIDFISNNQPLLDQALKQRLYVHRISGEYLHLDPLRAVLKTTFAICEHRQSDE